MRTALLNPSYCLEYFCGMVFVNISSMSFILLVHLRVCKSFIIRSTQIHVDFFFLENIRLDFFQLSGAMLMGGVLNRLLLLQVTSETVESVLCCLMGTFCASKSEAKL